MQPCGPVPERTHRGPCRRYGGWEIAGGKDQRDLETITTSTLLMLLSFLHKLLGGETVLFRAVGTVQCSISIVVNAFHSQIIGKFMEAGCGGWGSGLVS